MVHSTEPPGGFCDVGYSCCFTSLEVFGFRASFLCHRHWLLRLVKASASSEASWLLSIALLLPGFSVTSLSHFTASTTVLNRSFLPTGVFLPCTPSPHFGTFCDSDACRNTPSRIFLHACSHRVIPSV